MENSLTALFKTYTEIDNPPIIELLDKDSKPVGALYLDKLRYKSFLISETNTSEKYYFYTEGVGIYFSFYRKISN